MELFKYRGNYERDLISLANNQIYAPIYEKLNDPFEGMIDEAWDQSMLDFFHSLGDSNIKGVYDSVKEELKSIGIYSLSKDENNEILWSLYANAHEGFVIGYHLDKFLKDFNFNKICPLVHKIEVKYEENPSSILRWRNQPYKGINMGNAIGIKSKSWQHEQEVRLIFDQNGLNEYNFNSVSRIIFGLRASEENIDKTMRLLKGRNYKYQQVTLVENSFKLNIIDIPDRYPEDLRYIQNQAKFEEDLISEKKIGNIERKLKEKIACVINDIRKLPNITEITTVDILTEKQPEILNIFCNHKHKNLPVRFFQFQNTDEGFIQIN